MSSGVGGERLGPGEKVLGRGRIILVQIKTGPLEVDPSQGLGGTGQPGRVLGRQQVLGGCRRLALLLGHGGQIGLVDAGRHELLPVQVQVVGLGEVVPGLRIVSLLQGHGPQVVELLRGSLGVIHGPAHGQGPGEIPGGPLQIPPGK